MKNEIVNMHKKYPNQLRYTNLLAIQIKFYNSYIS